MEVILLERIEKLGQMGDIVSVKPGFARNFLLPRKKAMRATKGNLELFEGQKKQLEADNLSRREEAEKVASQLDGMKVVMIRSAGEGGQLYGSVTARDIAAGVTENGVTIDRNQVAMDHPIKAVGLHDTRISLHPEVSVTVVVNVARSDEEAQRQAKTGRAVSTAQEEADADAAAAAEAATAAEEFFETPPPEDLAESLVEAATEEEAPAEATEPAAAADEPESPAESADSGDIEVAGDAPEEDSESS